MVILSQLVSSLTLLYYWLVLNSVFLTEGLIFMNQFDFVNQFNFHYCLFQFLGE